MRSIVKISIFWLLALCCLQPAFSQERKLVSGRIVNSSDDNKPISDAIIFAYNTVAEAEDAYKSLIDARHNGGVFNPGYVVEAYPDTGGYYEVLVPETGALLFYTGIADPVIEKVNYRLEVNVSFALNIVLESSKVTAGGSRFALSQIPAVRGNKTIFAIDYKFPARDYGKTTARLVKQSRVECYSKDTLKKFFFKPMVYDGKQYHLTQLRRMNYDEQNDPLYQIADNNTRLTDTMTVISWIDSLPASFSATKSLLKWQLWVEDYTMISYADSGSFRTDRIARPMQFLEYPTQGYELDAERFRKKPRRERRDIAGDISLSFLIGKAQFDPSDPDNATNLDMLKSDLTKAVTGEGSSLREFHIEGTSSPDGPYKTNQILSEKRMDYAMQQIVSVLPKHVRDRVYMTVHSSVAPWTAVADLLQQDSLIAQAKEVNEIVSKYKERDKQWTTIKKLPYYNSLIVPRLPKLRSVKYTYVTEVYRELTPDEIISTYELDKSKGVEREYALYEYWNLFNMVNDEQELEKLYKQALAVSAKVESKPWVLPANNLAVRMIAKGQADTTLLTPFIDERYPCNYIIRDMNRRTEEIVNPAPVLANQVVMCLMEEDYEKAYRYSLALPSSYKELKAAAWCLAGYYDDTSEEGRENFVTMRKFSQRNRVIMNIANGNIRLATDALRGLPQDDPITSYLRVQIMCYGLSEASASMEIEDYDLALETLVYCFMSDKKFVAMADSDYMICEDLYKEAKQIYEQQQGGK